LTGILTPQSCPRRFLRGVQTVLRSGMDAPVPEACDRGVAGEQMGYRCRLRVCADDVRNEDTGRGERDHMEKQQGR